MSPPRLARGAAKVLAKDEVGAFTPSDEARAQTVDAIRDALRSRSKQRARRRWLVPIAAAAAAAALVTGAMWSSRRSPSSAIAPPTGPRDAVTAESVSGSLYVERGGERVRLESRATVASGEAVSAVAGEAVFALRSGTKLDVERGTEVAMVADGETELVRLDRGAVTSRVAKQHGAQRFIVRTADADVEVRGTVFRVSRLPEEACGERTRVRVTEGRVVVREVAGGGVTLEPGGEWASPCATSVGPAAVPAAVPTQDRGEVAAGRIATPRNPAGSARGATSVAVTTAAPASTATTERKPEPDPATSAAHSDLMVQNALFAEAMSAKSRGESRRAVASLDVLLEKYPRTPLREAAEAQRMNLLVTVDRARAQSLAKDYLARYPRGFARSDAEGIVRGAP